MKKSLKVVLIIIIVCAIIFPIIYPVYFSRKASDKNNDSPVASPKIQEYNPPFTKEGELEVLDGPSGKSIKRISIEIAENEKEITQGLMFRTSMLDTLGMLFVFDEPREHDFWMKNTKIPLDIIFIDDQQKIVTIQRNTTPYSEKEIPSEKEVLYVLEVNAGFCDKYGVKLNDYIRFVRMNPSSPI